MVKGAERMSGRLKDGTECVLHIDDNGPRLEIDREHTHPRELFEAPDEPERLVMKIADDRIATLTGVYRVHRRSNFARSFEEYRANIIYIGSTEFLPELGIRCLEFQPTNERLAVMYKAHRIHRDVSSEEATLKEILAGDVRGHEYYVDVIDLNRLEAFSAKSDGLTIGANVVLHRHTDIQGERTLESRNAYLSYDLENNIEIAITDMLTTCDFMSLMVGTVISPISVTITTSGEEDSFGRLPSFKVYAPWREPGSEIDPQNGRQCLSAPLLDSFVYKNAIAGWMARRDKWRTSYALGTICLTHHREVSSRRFLDATAWFESIPVAIYEKPRKRISKEVIINAAASAFAAFKSGGAEVDEKRARALLGSVNAASLSMRITDAMSLAREELGESALPDHLDPLAQLIPQIRGKFAHGKDAFSSEIGRFVYEATLLIEVLACVLTLKGLGGVTLTPDRQGHPLRRALRELRLFDAKVSPTN